MRVRDFGDLSFGGFSIETTAPVAPGVRHRFEIRTGHGLTVRAEACVRYCHPADEAGRYRSGWAFVRQRDLDEAIEVVVDAMPMAAAS